MKLKGIQIVTFEQIEFGKLIGLDLAGLSVGVAAARMQQATGGVREKRSVMHGAR